MFKVYGGGGGGSSGEDDNDDGDKWTINWLWVNDVSLAHNFDEDWAFLLNILVTCHFHNDIIVIFSFDWLTFV